MLLYTLHMNTDLVDLRWSESFKEQILTCEVSPSSADRISHRVMKQPSPQLVQNKTYTIAFTSLKQSTLQLIKSEPLHLLK